MIKNKELIGKIRCIHCNTYLRGRDLVYVDFINTITHQRCQPPIILKDQGTLREVLERYPTAEDVDNTKSMGFLTIKDRNRDS
ncbi:hypothetical protein [Lederbergia citrea]|uniref:hypothetical protein n=1 Tax=Lederbergia citrea TaxID=2833581 RepID=UPI001BC9FEC5|nr:hypothetical protein [Lederbergia citrea]MBS4204810.1 hypothetical protein [Lederbergia citrea]